MGDAILTNHAIQRSKERVGLKKGCCQKKADKAIKYGLLKGVFGGSFRQYLDNLYFQHKTATHLRVYGEHIYLFSPEGVLITVMHVPTKYKRIVNKTGRKHGVERTNGEGTGILAGETISGDRGNGKGKR